MSRQLAIDLSIALVSDDRLVIDAVDDKDHIEDIIAEIIDQTLDTHEKGEKLFFTKSDNR